MNLPTLPPQTEVRGNALRALASVIDLSLL